MWYNQINAICQFWVATDWELSEGHTTGLSGKFEKWVDHSLKLFIPWRSSLIYNICVNMSVDDIDKYGLYVVT